MFTNDSHWSLKGFGLLPEIKNQYLSQLDKNTKTLLVKWACKSKQTGHLYYTSWTKLNYTMLVYIFKFLSVPWQDNTWQTWWRSLLALMSSTKEYIHTLCSHLFLFCADQALLAMRRCITLCRFVSIIEEILDLTKNLWWAGVKSDIIRNFLKEYSSKKEVNTLSSGFQTLLCYICTVLAMHALK